MKIVHIMIAAFYKEGYGYQENILPAKHQQLGFDVSIITYDRYNVFGGLPANDKGIKSYINDRGVKVIVLPKNNTKLMRWPLSIFKICLKKTLFLYDTLVEEHPDIIFVHGIQSADHEIIVKYKKKNPSVKVYCDNHADFYNTPVISIKKKIQIALIGRKYVRDLTNVCERVWGVTPWRIDYLRQIYGVSGPKVGLLVMGGDEQLIDWDNRLTIRARFRSEHNIPQNAFVLVTGGKIDKAKNIHILIDTVKQIDNPMLYLVVFGNYNEDLKQYELENNPRIVNIGWVPSDSVYDIFLSSDFGVFPGTHSVLWEQVCAAGLPCIFKDWDGGFNHVDLGGNCILVKDITIESLSQTLESILNDKMSLSNMHNVAVDKCRKYFSYIEIAKKSIEIS